MAASYPGTKRDFGIAHVDTVDVVYASHMNDVQDEIRALQDYIGVNPHVSTAGGGSTFGAWSGVSRTYQTLGDRLANIEAGLLADTHTQYARLTGTETFTGTKTFSATDTFFGAGTTTTSGNIVLSSGTTGGQSSVLWREGTTNRWSQLFTQGTTSLRLRDLTNARDHITYTPGASSTAANTTLASNLTVGGNSTLSGTLAVTGLTTVAGLTMTGALTLAAGTGTAASDSAVGDTATGGTSTTVARADHVHGRESFGSATVAVTAGGAAAAGAATTPSRSDHAHALAAGNPAASAPGDAMAQGTAATVARADHVHPREAAPTPASVGAVAKSGDTMTGTLSAPRVNSTGTVAGFNDGTLTKATGGGFSASAAWAAPTVTGTSGVFDGAARVYSEVNPPPSAAPVVIMPFFVGGSIGVGLRRPQFLATVPMRIRGARSISHAGSGTYQVYVNGVSASGAATAFGVAQALHDFADVDINVGDRVQLNVASATADAVDLSVTVDVVTR